MTTSHETPEQVAARLEVAEGFRDFAERIKKEAIEAMHGQLDVIASTAQYMLHKRIETLELLVSELADEVAIRADELAEVRADPCGFCKM